MKQAQAPKKPRVLDQYGRPIERNQSNSALDLLALGAGLALLMTAKKSRSPIGGLIKGGTATVLLSHAVKNTGVLGKVARLFSKSTPPRQRQS